MRGPKPLPSHPVHEFRAMAQSNTIEGLRVPGHRVTALPGHCGKTTFVSRDLEFRAIPLYIESLALLVAPLSIVCSRRQDERGEG